LGELRNIPSLFGYYAISVDSMTKHSSQPSFVIIKRLVEQKLGFNTLLSRDITLRACIPPELE
jgi:hypothetical protein